MARIAIDANNLAVIAVWTHITVLRSLSGRPRSDVKPSTQNSAAGAPMTVSPSTRKINSWSNMFVPGVRWLDTALYSFGIETFTNQNRRYMNRLIDGRFLNLQRLH